ATISLAIRALPERTWVGLTQAARSEEPAHEHADSLEAITAPESRAFGTGRIHQNEPAMPRPAADGTAPSWASTHAPIGASVRGAPADTRTLPSERAGSVKRVWPRRSGGRMSKTLPATRSAAPESATHHAASSSSCHGHTRDAALASSP